MITIVDYGMGNLGSIVNMLKRINCDAVATRDIESVRSATKIILPGVGAFDAAMDRINESGLREVLEHKVMTEKMPILGICLGMQLLTCGSEEGSSPGLGWIQASTRRFPSHANLKVPHMGWNIVSPSSPSILTNGLPDEARFYFVHSYYVVVYDTENSVISTINGFEFDSSIQRDNIF